MIEQQQKLVLSPYMEIYELVIPKDNLLRQIKELVDFSFIYDELLANYCLDNGRNAVPPIRMFKYLLLKSIYDLSDVDVVERSKYDMSFKYFLDMAPEDEVINPSSLTKFRKLRLKDMNLLDMLIAKTVQLAILHVYFVHRGDCNRYIKYSFTLLEHNVSYRIVALNRECRVITGVLLLECTLTVLGLTIGLNF